jgi:hypothetical protein
MKDLVKTVLCGSVAAAVLMAAAVPAVARDSYVRGYYRRDGTYVAPHYRSTPDGNRFNNWSTEGNVNPYTGRPGTVSPYGGTRPYGGSLIYQDSNPSRYAR